jgi:hypothetical protein
MPHVTTRNPDKPKTLLRRACLTAKAIAYEFLALLALQALGAGVLPAGGRLAGLVATRRCGGATARQALLHEGLAFRAFERLLFRVLAARGHALAMRFLRGARFLLGRFLGQCEPCQHHYKS